MADERGELLREFIAPFRVKPGSKVVLAKDFDPGYRGRFLNKEDSADFLQRGVQILAEYQDRLAAQDQWGVLVCLQALDAAGKDGTIRHVMSGVNPQGVHVRPFKLPSYEELDHDFLWRYAQHLPARGDISIFNRSHYEEVLVVRVHPEILGAQRLPESIRSDEDIWEKRYRDINAFEHRLVDNGFKVVKLFLNLSREEQRRRFLKRINEREKNWKLSVGDVRERAFWDDYQHAFSEMLSNTSTEWAPWYVIPADHKWFARICVSAILALTLLDIDPQFPEMGPEAQAQLDEAKAKLEAEEGAEAEEPGGNGKKAGKNGKKEKGGKKAGEPARMSAEAEEKARELAQKARKALAESEEA